MSERKKPAIFTKEQLKILANLEGKPKKVAGAFSGYDDITKKMADKNNEDLAKEVFGEIGNEVEEIRIQKYDAKAECVDQEASCNAQYSDQLFSNNIKNEEHMNHKINRTLK